MAIYTLSVHLEISTLADCRPVHLSYANVQSSSCKITNNSTGYTENGAEAVGYILHMYLCNWKLNTNLYKVNFANADELNINGETQTHANANAHARHALFLNT